MHVAVKTPYTSRSGWLFNTNSKWNPSFIILITSNNAFRNKTSSNFIEYQGGHVFRLTQFDVIPFLLSKFVLGNHGVR